MVPSGGSEDLPVAANRHVACAVSHRRRVAHRYSDPPKASRFPSSRKSTAQYTKQKGKESNEMKQVVGHTEALLQVYTEVYEAHRGPAAADALYGCGPSPPPPPAGPRSSAPPAKGGEFGGI
eukprot:1194065-Prorocentrum_minimum.AAC.3